MVYTLKLIIFFIKSDLLFALRSTQQLNIASVAMWNSDICIDKVPYEPVL